MNIFWLYDKWFVYKAKKNYKRKAEEIEFWYIIFRHDNYKCSNIKKSIAVEDIIGLGRVKVVDALKVGGKKVEIELKCKEI